ncbi:MAG: prolyl-tRNA synthetase associated domain-containing protein [Bacilli bacterium]|jgi:Ala-tRNA(Pro) deacylase|nr:prolyl-tRNA synthetase associated domain-containing protein [Bacilli bacterium]
MEQKLYKKLEELNIKIEKQEHEAVHTIEEILKLDVRLDGMGLKNLFVKDKFDNRYMIVVEENKRVDLKKIKENLDLNKLSFCKEDELRNILKIEPGSVTPLAAINDDENEVTIILDEDMVDKNILVHPLVNTATIKINYNDMIKLFNNLKTNYIVTNIPEKQELA